MRIGDPVHVLEQPCIFVEDFLLEGRQCLAWSVAGEEAWGWVAGGCGGHGCRVVMVVGEVVV